MGNRLTSIELCAGAGGQAIGVERAGFEHLELVELDPHCVETLRQNRKKWRNRVRHKDVERYDASSYKGIVDLLAAGLPCPPFSVAGKQLGEEDERNLFPAALKIIDQCNPRAVMIENVRGILDPVFKLFRESFQGELKTRGYESDFYLLHASDFGVPQLRPRVVFVAIKKHLWKYFVPPTEGVKKTRTRTVGQTLHKLMAASGWRGADAWKQKAKGVAPTIVGGSHKHGGPDLGPTRAKKAWEAMFVNAHKLADAPPAKDFDPDGRPHLTVQMVGLLQGFPRKWEFVGKKTHAYRQAGNAFPPPVAAHVAKRIAAALVKDATTKKSPAKERTRNPEKRPLPFGEVA